MPMFLLTMIQRFHAGHCLCFGCCAGAPSGDCIDISMIADATTWQVDVVLSDIVPCESPVTGWAILARLVAVMSHKASEVTRSCLYTASRTPAKFQVAGVVV